MNRQRLLKVALLAFVVALVSFVSLAQMGLTATPARAGSCSSQGGQSVTDPNTGWHWTTKWYCGNRGGAYMYKDASYTTKTAIMDSTWSWFVCYRRGVTHAGGNNVWYYSLGDRTVAGQEANHAWGYMPAVDVWTSTDPWPGMPACPSAGSPTPTPQPVTCSHPVFKYYPGSASSNLRYGEVDFTFDACSNVAPVNWGRSVTKLVTNNTATLLGFNLTGASISVTGYGSGYADYEGVFTYETCDLRLPIFCEDGATPFKVRFHGYIDSSSNAPYVYFTNGEVPFTYEIFTTP